MNDTQILAAIKAAYPGLTAATRASIGDAAIAAQISSGLTQTVSTKIGPGDVLNTLGPGPGAAVLAAIDAQAGTNEANPAYWGLQLLQKDGLDVSLASTQGQLAALVTAGTMTQAQMTALVGLSVIPSPISVDAASRVLNENGY